ncbi:MAG: ATP synthase subunit I [Gammaproteobacteria bacterium]|nr:ATP synthase subunit I [Gammaproteobacteria bacterium]
MKIQFILGGFYFLGIAFWDNALVLSALVGCMAALVPNTYFYIRMGKQAENNDAQQWLSYAYRSEFGKWLMTGMIFLLAFTSNHSWDPIVLFAGYVLIQISSGFVPFIFKGN